MTNTTESRDFGKYKTSNPWLNKFLTLAGIDPLEEVPVLTGRVTWIYSCNDALRSKVAEFRKISMEA